MIFCLHFVANRFTVCDTWRWC